jgi:hypothetical protein
MSTSFKKSAGCGGGFINYATSSTFDRLSAP